MKRISLGKTPKPVLIVGSMAYDHIITPTADSGRVAGGSANYAAVAATHFAYARLVDVVGRDYEPALIDLLEKRGADLSGVAHDDTGDTFFWRGKYGENFNRREALVTALNVFANFRPTLPPAYRKSEYVLFGAIQPSLQSRVLDELEGAPFTVADTIQHWVDETRDDLLALLRRVSMVCINDDEAFRLAGCENIFRAGEYLRRETAPVVLIKKGEHGSVLFHPEGTFILPAYPVRDVADPTGAGDSFAGALVGALAAQGDVSFPALKRAMLYATAVGSLAVESFCFTRVAAENAGDEIVRRVETLQSLISL